MKKKTMKKIILLLLSALCILGAAGCEDNGKEAGGYQVYYINKEGTKLVSESYVPQETEQKALIKELADKLGSAPYSSDLKSVKPENLVFTGFSTEGRQLTVDCSSSYSEMDNISEVLFRAAVVKTLVQLPDIDNVSFTIEGSPLRDYVGAEVGPMTAETFIDTRGKGINSYQYAALPLYFADGSGEMIVKEIRNVHYSTNTTLEKVVVEQLIKGPANGRLQAVVPSDTKLLSVSVKDGRCTVNFSGSVNKSPDGSAVQPMAAVYSIVNSLCDACSVTEVTIQVDGESQIMYRDSVSLEEPFMRNKDIIEALPVSGTTAGEVSSEGLDPSIGIDKIQGGKN